MKNSKFFGKLSIFLMLWACSTEIKEEKQAPKTQIKNIHFEGLEVKHRFSMPAKYLDDEADAKLLPAIAHNNSQKLTDYALEDVAEVAKTVFKRFPYPSEDKNFTTDIAMIKRDFPKLNEKEIVEKDSLIEKYYDLNLDYEVLQILKKTKKPLNKKEENFVLESKVEAIPDDAGGGGSGGGGYSPPPYNPNCSTKMPYLTKHYVGSAGASLLVIKRVLKSRANINFKINKTLEKYLLNFQCVKHRAFSNFSTVLSYWAFYKASRKAADSGFSGWDGPNDAKRHIYWSALLANHYFTVSSKMRRIEFAKACGDENEYCGDNNVDASEMDFHNNAIGRELFSQNTKYKTITIDLFFTTLTITYGLNLPSDSTLKTKAENKVNNQNVKPLDTLLKNNYIYKNIKNPSIENKKMCFRKNYIKYHMNSKIPVILKP